MDNVRRYFETVEDALFSNRYSTKANFASQQFETYLSVGAFDTGALFVNEVLGDGLRYRAVHLSEIFLAEHEASRIDTIFRKTKMTLRQMLQRWGKDRVSLKVASQVEAKPDESIDVPHVVLPSAEYNDGEADRPFASLYIVLSSRPTRYFQAD